MDAKEKLINFYSIGWELNWLKEVGNRAFKRYKYRMLDTIDLIEQNTLENFSILDVGCGIGLYSLEILRRFKNCTLTGLDISKRQIDFLNKNLVASFKDRAEFIVADAEDFNLAKKYEYIICTEVLEHFQNPKSVIRNIILHASNSTKIIISVPHIYLSGKSGWFYRQFINDSRWIETQDFSKISPKKEYYEFYHKQYDVEEIEALLNDSDLSIDKIRYCNLRLTNKHLKAAYFFIAFRRLDKFLNWLTLNKHASNITLLCKKN